MGITSSQGPITRNRSERTVENLLRAEEEGCVGKEKGKRQISTAQRESDSKKGRGGQVLNKLCRNDVMEKNTGRGQKSHGVKARDTVGRGSIEGKGSSHTSPPRNTTLTKRGKGSPQSADAGRRKASA